MWNLKRQGITPTCLPPQFFGVTFNKGEGENMKFDLENLNPSTKFYLDENDESEGFVELRVCPKAEIDRISKATSKKVTKYRSHVPYETIESDDVEADELLWDYCITGWEIFDAANNPIPCDKQAKAVLMSQEPFFSQFVTGKLAELRDSGLKNREVLEKNSPAMQKKQKENQIAPTA